MAAFEGRQTLVVVCQILRYRAYVISVIIISIMGKNKNGCWACNKKHFPPMGKNCQKAPQNTQDGATTEASSGSEKDDRDSLSGHIMLPQKLVKSHKLKSADKVKDTVSKKVKSSSHQVVSGSDEGESPVDEAEKQNVQHQILAELKKMNTRLNVVEAQVAEGRTWDKRKKSKGHKLSRSHKCTKYNKARDSSSDSSESSESSVDESCLPCLAHIRSSREIQRKIDKSLAKLGHSQVQGKDTSQKLK